ncbi:MAG: DMT family transporter [Thermoanaerobacteraceae bacterium]|nr:DMT family transporter [Thermoanaerobacteraceae bacterium]
MPGGGNKSLQLKADLALLGVTFIWGITFVVVQNALDSIGPYYFLGVRFLLAFLFLGAIYYRQLLKLDGTTLQAGHRPTSGGNKDWS